MLTNYRKNNSFQRYANLAVGAYNAYNRYGGSVRSAANTVSGYVRPRTAPSRRMAPKRLVVKTNPTTHKKKLVRKPTKTKVLSKKISKLVQQCNVDTGTFTHRYRSAGTLASAVQVANQISVNGCTTTEVDTQLSHLQYYDIDNPGVLKTVDGRIGTFQKQFNFTTIGSKITIKNNYKVPCKVELFLCEPKVDTSITAKLAFETGITDVTDSASTSPQVHVTDSQFFMDTWKIVRSKTKILKAGAEIVESVYYKDFIYDPSQHDAHALFYQKSHHSHQWFIRIQGILSHDSVTADMVGIGPAKIDYQLDQKWVIKYPAGGDLNRILCTDVTSAIVNDANISQLTISQQALSI